jgi:hypothetical protein
MSGLDRAARMGKKDTQLKKGHRRGGRQPKIVQREKFAQAVAAGKNFTDAYKEARQECVRSCKPASINRAALRLAQDEWVVKRVAEIKAEATRIATEKAGIDKAWVVERLRSVVERCLQAEPVLNREGNQTGEFNFNAAGANKALELLGKEIGCSWIARRFAPAPSKR